MNRNQCLSSHSKAYKKRKAAMMYRYDYEPTHFQCGKERPHESGFMNTIAVLFRSGWTASVISV